MQRLLTVLIAFLLMMMSSGCTPSLDLRKAEKHMKKSRWSEAERLLQEIADAHKGSKWEQKALLLKGSAQFRQSRLDEAERTFRAGRDALPEGEWADDCEYYLARVNFRQGDYRDALAGFKRVLTAYGDDPKRSNMKVLALQEMEFIQKQGLVHGED